MSTWTFHKKKIYSIFTKIKKKNGIFFQAVRDGFETQIWKTERIEIRYNMSYIAK